MGKITTNDFIKSCIERHCDRYDYSLVEYKNMRSKIDIICKEHGIFIQNPKNHRDGQGCPKCYGNRNLTKEEFINLCRNKNYYDYSLIDDKIIKIKSLIKVIDKSTGLIYQQFANHHLDGLKPTKIESKSLITKLSIIHNNKFDYIIEKETYYSTDKIKIVNKLTNDIFEYRVDRHLKGMSPNKVTLNLFLYKSKEKHNDRYDYSLVKEVNGNSDKVDIICNDHGIFKQSVSGHMNLGHGCPICIGKGKWSNDVLISEFNKVHFDLYDYSKINFEGVDIKVDIICKEHGIFSQNIHKHLKGQGCPECKQNSKGEEYIKNYLERNEIKYIRQKSFDDCKYINRLNFDFYLPDMNTCLEFDGLQHFEPVKEFGGEKEFDLILKRDECKNKWCVENSVNLIRIRYDEFDKISEILDKKLQLFVNKK
jgi:very-short-patch-repair endonuclease